MTSGADKPRRARFTAFRVGVLAGLATMVALVAWFWIVTAVYEPAPKYNVMVMSSGADVSRHGGRKLVISSEQGVLYTQACSEACDDLRYEAATGENAYRVQVFDGAGACVVCSDKGYYTTSGYGAPVTTWTVSGREKLEVRIDLRRP